MLKTPTIKPIADTLRKGCYIDLNNALHKNLSITSKKYLHGEDMFITELKNAENKILGKEIFGFSPSNMKEMFGFDILISQFDDRNKGNYWGELLRLISIIEMLENKMQEFRIYSKNTAIYFHSKYKFEPNINSIEDSINALKSMTLAKGTFLEDLATRAEELLDTIEKNKANLYGNQNFFGLINWSVRQYIEEILNLKKDAYKDFPFKNGFYMRLPKEKIDKNAPFFSQLFEKHGIKYDL